MHVVFITNQYLPIPMANGVCVHEIAKALVGQCEKVTVICSQDNPDHVNETIDGVNIVRVRKSFAGRFIDSNKENESKLGWGLRFFGNILRRTSRLVHLNQYPLEDMGLVRRYVAAAEAILKDQKSDVTLVATYTPMEAVYAVGCLSKRHKGLKTVFYSLDTLSNESGKGFIPLPVRSYLGQKHEIESFRLFRKVILMRCHERHYSDGAYDSVRDRFVFADFPLFNPKASEFTPAKIKAEAGMKRIIYAGSFYRWIRNPQLVLQRLEPLMDRVKIDFYGYSDCDDIIEPYVEKYKGHVAIHGLVPRAVVMKEMEAADVILSIGNSGTEMAPSKVYECMATGKSILHVYFQDNDPCVVALKKYSNSLCIDARKEADIRSVSEFINHAHVADTFLLRETYYESTPEYTAKLILSD